MLMVQFEICICQLIILMMIICRYTACKYKHAVLSEH
jgi:hypothetical protein